MMAVTEHCSVQGKKWFPSGWFSITSTSQHQREPAAGTFFSLHHPGAAQGRQQQTGHEALLHPLLPCAGWADPSQLR